MVNVECPYSIEREGFGIVPIWKLPIEFPNISQHAVLIFGGEKQEVFAFDADSNSFTLFPTQL